MWIHVPSTTCYVISLRGKDIFVIYNVQGEQILQTYQNEHHLVKDARGKQTCACNFETQKIPMKILLHNVLELFNVFL